MSLLASFLTEPLWKDGFLFVWQIPAVLVMVGLIIFWVMYRRKQM